MVSNLGKVNEWVVFIDNEIPFIYYHFIHKHITCVCGGGSFMVGWVKHFVHMVAGEGGGVKTLFAATCCSISHN